MQNLNLSVYTKFSKDSNKFLMKALIEWYTRLNLYLKLIPFLILFITIIVVFTPNEYMGDELRYLMFANNLLNGYYSPPAPDINLWGGPGYPILITPFLFFKLPYVIIRIANGFLLYFSLIINYKLFSIYSSKNTSLVFTILLGLYFPGYTLLPMIYTECFTFFLVSVVCLFFILNFSQERINWIYIILCGFAIACLALTKIIFGYVIVTMLLFSCLMLCLSKFRQTTQKSVLILIFALVFCSPYLIYTYSLTKKPFYWGDSGGMSLYTMSTPYPDELGDWKLRQTLQNNPNHTDFIDSIYNLNALERDEAYKSRAIENIKNYPQKYFSNWIANIGRLLFSYPYTKPQTIKTYFTIIPNMFVIVSLCFALLIALLSYKKVPKEIIFLFIFFMVYLGGSSFLSAYRRWFYITLPFWYLFLSYVYDNLVSITIRRSNVAT